MKYVSLILAAAALGLSIWNAAPNAQTVVGKESTHSVIPTMTSTATQTKAPTTTPRTRPMPLAFTATESLEPGTYETIGHTSGVVTEKFQTKIVFVRRETTGDIFLIESSGLPARFRIRYDHLLQAVNPEYPKF